MPLNTCGVQYLMYRTLYPLCRSVTDDIKKLNDRSKDDRNGIGQIFEPTCFVALQIYAAVPKTDGVSKGRQLQAGEMR